MTMQFNDCTYFFPVIGILILSKSSLSENTATTSVDRREDGDIFYGQMVNNQTCTDRWAHLIINDGTVTCYCPNGILFAVAKDEIPSCYYEVDSMEVCRITAQGFEDKIPLLESKDSPQFVLNYDRKSCKVSDVVSAADVQYWNPTNRFSYRTSKRLFFESVLQETILRLLFIGSKLPPSLTGSVVKVSFTCTTNSSFNECMLFKINGSQTWERILEPSTSPITDFTTTTTTASFAPLTSQITTTTSRTTFTTPSTITSTITTNAGLDRTSIVVIVVVGVVVLLLLLIIIYCIIKKKKMKERANAGSKVNNSNSDPLGKRTLSNVIFREEGPERDVNKHHTYQNSGFVNQAFRKDSEEQQQQHVYETMKASSNSTRNHTQQINYNDDSGTYFNNNPEYSTLTGVTGQTGYNNSNRQEDQQYQALRKS